MKQRFFSFFRGSGSGYRAAVNNRVLAANKRSRVNKPSHALSPSRPTDVGRLLAAFKSET